MTPHDVLFKALGAAVTLAVAASASILGILDDADPSKVATWVGSSGLIAYIAWRVWSDSRATDALRASLESQISAMTADRDHWRDRTERAELEIRGLAVRLAALERDQGGV